MEYKIDIIESFGKKSYKWMYTIIDLVIFFILLFSVGWAGAFIVSAAIGYILNAVDPLSKDNTKIFNYSLLFEKDQILFKSEEKERFDIIVPFDSISAVEDIKIMPENNNSQILIRRGNDSGIIFTLSDYSQKDFKELLEKIKSEKKSHSNDSELSKQNDNHEKIADENNSEENNESSNYEEFLDKIKENLPNYHEVYLSDTYPKVLLIQESFSRGSHSTYIAHVPEISKEIVKSFQKTAHKYTEKELGIWGTGNFMAKILVSENIDDESKSFINGFRRRYWYAFYDLTNNTPISHKNFMKLKFFDFEN